MYELVSTAFISVLLENLLNEEDEVVAVHLKSLERLLQAEGKIIALDSYAFDALVSSNEKRRASLPTCLTGRITRQG